MSDNVYWLLEVNVKDGELDSLPHLLFKPALSETFRLATLRISRPTLDPGIFLSHRCRLPGGPCDVAGEGIFLVGR